MPTETVRIVIYEGRQNHQHITNIYEFKPGLTKRRKFNGFTQSIFNEIMEQVQQSTSDKPIRFEVQPVLQKEA